ncbi:MAG TPA: CdaR family protein [Thermoanaerobaculia bacterium]|nr:CdaR family protein [Thermoanaerobaculia bacterium]
MKPRSERLWPLQLLALTAAIVAWFFASYLPDLERRTEPRIERELEGVVSYEVREGFMILNPAQRVQVRLRGPEEQVRNLRPGDIDVEVPFPDPVDTNAPNVVPLGLTYVTVPEGLEVTGLSPERLTLLIDERITKEVEVIPDFRGEPAAGARVQRDKIVVVPATVNIEGPRQKVELLDRARTEPIDLTRHGLTFRENARVTVEDPDTRVVGANVVTVEVPMTTPGQSSPPESDP